MDGGLDKTFYISTTNKTNSNNNWCLPNHKSEIFIVVHIIDFMDLKLHLWHISKTIKTKAKKEENTSSSVVLIKHSIANKTKREIQTCAQIAMKLYF